VAGPANVKKVEFASKPEKPAERTYAKADVRHARLEGGLVGFLSGLAVMFAIIWIATTWTAESTVENFSRGVAMGKAVGDGH